MLRKCQEKYGGVKKEITTLAKRENPELDDSTFLIGDKISHYQPIIGTGQ
jgi:hypothetical protein